MNRRAPSRQPNKRVLIVCEGSKTEPFYFEELVRDLRVHGEVEITGKCGSAPISVVDKAFQLYENNGGYDLIFCVFDKDGHASFDNAIGKVSSAKLKTREGGCVVHVANVVAITSVPCFEYWILLHYSDTSAPMMRYADVLPYLRRIPGLSNYDKGARKLYSFLKDRTDTAIANAKRVQAGAIQSGSKNPLTNVHELVTSLRALVTKQPSAE